MADSLRSKNRISRLAGMARRHGAASTWNHILAAVSLRTRPVRLVSWPRFIQIEVTSRCNMACVQCSRSTLGKPECQGNMSLDVFDRVLSGFKHYQYVTLHGLGEPLMNPQLEDMVRLLRQRSPEVVVGFNTNGLLLTPQKAIDLAEAGLDEIGISLDAATDETFLRIRGSDKLREIKKNIATIVSGPGPRPKLAVTLVVMEPNIRELVAFVEMAHAIGVDRASFCDLSSRWKPASGEDPMAVRDVETAREESAKAERRASKLGLPFVYTKLDDAIWPDVFIPCFYLWDYPYITWEGKLTPCCALPYAEEFSLGDLRERPFRELWNGKIYRRMRTDLREGVIPDVCEGCHHAEDPALGHVCTCDDAGTS